MSSHGSLRVCKVWVALGNRVGERKERPFREEERALSRFSTKYWAPTDPPVDRLTEKKKNNLIFNKKAMTHGWYYVEIWQRHDRVQTESQELQTWQLFRSCWVSYVLFNPALSYVLYSILLYFTIFLSFISVFQRSTFYCIPFLLSCRWFSLLQRSTF